MSKKKTETLSPTSVQKPMFDTTDATGGTNSDFDRLMAELEHIEAKSQAMEDDEARLAAIDEQTQRAFEQAKREEAKRKEEEERAKNGTPKKFFQDHKSISPEKADCLAKNNGTDALEDVLNDIIEDEFEADMPDEYTYYESPLDDEVFEEPTYEEPQLQPDMHLTSKDNIQEIVQIVEPIQVNVPDEIMNDMTPKDLLRYWMEEILSIEKQALQEYYSNSSYMYDELKRKDSVVKGMGIDRKKFTKDVFKFAYEDVIRLLQFVCKLTSKDVQSGKDIIVAIYGLSSDEMYIYREFYRRYDEMYKWDETEMFGCSNERLKRILCI